MTISELQKFFILSKYKSVKDENGSYLGSNFAKDKWPEGFGFLQTRLPTILENHMLDFSLCKSLIELPNFCIWDTADGLEKEVYEIDVKVDDQIFSIIIVQKPFCNPIAFIGPDFIQLWINAINFA